MQTHLTHINTIFEHFDASVILENVDFVLYLKDANIYKPILKTKTATMFLFKKTFSSFQCVVEYEKNTMTSSVMGKVLRKKNVL